MNGPASGEVPTSAARVAVTPDQVGPDDRADRRGDKHNASPLGRANWCRQIRTYVRACKLIATSAP